MPKPLHRTDALSIVKRRAEASGLTPDVCNHSFSGGTIEKAQQMAGHRSPRTTKLYDRTSDTISQDEIERIVL